MDIVSNLSTAITLTKRLREISKNIEISEFKNVLADLLGELADAKIEAASVKEKIAELMEENQKLKQQLAKSAESIAEPPTGTKWGLYQWEPDTALHCTACWDSKNQKSRVTRINKAGVMWMCPVCKAVFGR